MGYKQERKKQEQTKKDKNKALISCLYPKNQVTTTQIIRFVVNNAYLRVITVKKVSSDRQAITLAKEKIMHFIVSTLDGDLHGVIELTDVVMHQRLDLGEEVTKKAMKELEREGSVNFYTIQSNTTRRFVDLYGDFLNALV
jgi:hypothetical protein